MMRRSGLVLKIEKSRLAMCAFIAASHSTTSVFGDLRPTRLVPVREKSVT
jgi:hypothetical protein